MLVNCGGPDVRELPVAPSQKETVLAAGEATQSRHDPRGAGSLDRDEGPDARQRRTRRCCWKWQSCGFRRLEELLSVGQLAVRPSASQEPRAGPVATGTARHTGASSVAAEGAKKNGSLTDEPEPSGLPVRPEDSPLLLTESTVPEIWKRLNHYLSEKSPILANHLKLASLPAIFGPNSLAIRFH